MHERRMDVTSAEIDSLSWIWTHSKFCRWRDAKAYDDSNLLWIQGKPGSGKSTLAKYIRQGMSSHHSSACQMQGISTQESEAANKREIDEMIVVDHFYSARKGKFGTDHSLMLRSVFYQLAEADPGLFPSLRPVLSRVGEASERGFLETLEGSLEALLGALTESAEIVAQKRRIMCIVIDAMDEAEFENRSCVANTSETIRERLLSFMSETLVIKWIILSRPANDIDRIFSGVNKIVMERVNKPVIEALVSKQKDNMRCVILDANATDTDQANRKSHRTSMALPNRFRRTIAEDQSGRSVSPTNMKELDQTLAEVERYIWRHADGVVLWVELILGELHLSIRKGYYSRKQISSKLESLPPTLEKLYADIVRRLGEGSDSYLLATARAMLTWACFAERPLTVAEFRDAIAIGYDLDVTMLTPLDLDEARIQVYGSWKPVQL